MRWYSKYLGNLVRKKDGKQDGDVPFKIWHTGDGGRARGWFRAVLTAQCWMDELACEGPWKRGRSAHGSRAWSEEGSIKWKEMSEPPGHARKTICAAEFRMDKEKNFCNKEMETWERAFSLRKAGKRFVFWKTFIFGDEMHKNLYDVEGE